MDIFQSENIRVDKAVDELIPQLEELGARGNIIGESLQEISRTLKQETSTDIHTSPADEFLNIEKRIQNVADDFHIYIERYDNLVEVVTYKIVQIRYRLLTRVLLTIGTRPSTSGFSVLHCLETLSCF